VLVVREPSRSTSAHFFKKIRLRAPILAKTKVARIGSAALAMIVGGGFYRRPQAFVRLIALVLSIVCIAVFLRLGTQRDVIRAPESPLEAAAMSTELVATAPAQSEVVPETRRLIHNSGLISFQAPTVHASAAQSLVAISVKHAPAINSGAFLWRVERGTAQPGVDYERIQPQVVRFIEGQTVRTLYIPLINGPATSVQRGPRTFTVTLDRVEDGPALGRFARVTVIIDPPPTSSSM
jgi:hypothetical protein